MKQLFNATVLSALLATLAVPAAFAASATVERPFRLYSVADGLTQSDVTDIAQDRAGYLWFTTVRGLNRFDGREFDQFTIADGLASNNLTALAVDANNVVWVGDVRGGVTAVRSGRIAERIDPVDVDSGPVIDLIARGNEVFGLVPGIGVVQAVRQSNGYMLQPIVGEGMAVQSLAVADDSVWVVADGLLYRLVTEPRVQLQEIAPDILLAAGAGDRLWLVDSNNRIGTLSDNRFDALATVPSATSLDNIAVDTGGTVWVSNASEIFSLSGAESGAAPEMGHYDGFDNVRSIFLDREHTLWMSANSRLIRFLGDRFRHYKLQTETDPETVWTIAEDPEGRFWFGTENKILLMGLDGTLSRLGAESGLPSGSVRDIVAGSDHRLWAGIRDKGLYEIDTNSLGATLVADTEGLGILDVDAGDPGLIWFSTASSGIYRYDVANGALQNYAAPGNTSVYSLDVAADGSIWYGADDVALVHLTRINDNEFRQEMFDSGDGLLHRQFNHVLANADGDVWIATEEGGLYLFSNGRFSSIGRDKLFSDQTIYIVQPLADGSVVLGGEQGLFQFVPGESRTVHYNAMTGFIGLETNVHASYMDSGGNFWIGTVDGVSRMDTSMPMPPHVELTPQIVRMETAMGGQAIPDGARIEPGQRGALVEYAAVSLTNPKNVEFSYRLEGVDADWTPATPNRTVSYSRIPPGSYRFAVRARNPGGEWSQTAETRQFTVQPFFWQRPTVLLSALLVLLLAVRGVMNYRTRNIQRLNEKLTVQVAERTESIEKAREKLQASNEQLSREIQERQKSDQARFEVETRFRRAFENAPIGMGLLDLDGKLFDANPALLSMLWPGARQLPEVRFADAIDEVDRERFISLYQKLVSGQRKSIEEKFACYDSSGAALSTEVNLSTVVSDSGDYLYSVLQVQDVTESLKLTDKLEYQAMYDELTGLLNRRAFEAELARAWEHGRGAATKSYLMFMDLDQFKVVNDTSGHAAGDMLLKQISEMLVDSVRANDTVGRLGGDEFAIILWKCPVEVAQRIAEAIRASVEAYRFQWDKETYRVGVSVGGIPIDPDVGDIGELQQLADAACYAAKEAGRNRVHMVEGDRDSARVHRGQVRWVQRLREAMDNNRFAIYGQVIKPLDEARIEPERFEILLRLRDPSTRKLIPPGAFLPAAERYGLSLELDEWVVRSLLDALFIHQSFHAEYRRYWINLSGTSIGDPRFAMFLKKVIEHSPLPPGTINFEITERAVIRNVSEAGRLMSELRDMGCQFALDDFGSGVSSFGYLKKLPVDYLKVDGSFIRDILNDETNRIFVKSIIDIAHTLDIQTVCEFIENKEMLDVVRDLGADYAQGFAVGRPFVLAPRFPGAAEAHAPAATELKQQAV